jgi:RNA-directed DNA polymerase
VGFPRATHPVIIFEQERDARRVLDVLPKRLAKYSLTLHPEKTRLIDFSAAGPEGYGVARQQSGRALPA